MARKSFLIIYPDRSKKHVDAFERDQMLLAGELQRVDQNSYKWVGEVKTFHTFADLAGLRDKLTLSTTLRRFLPGQFTIEHPRRLGGQREHERLQTPEAMKVELERRGMPVGGFEAAA